MLPALPSFSSQPTSAFSMLASVGLTLKVHLLPPTPDFSAIDVADALATTTGTPARSTSGMMASATELQRPSWMATYFFAASIWVTLFTASAGLQRLSWKSISILRPSTPPSALASAMRQLGAPARMLAEVGDAAGERDGGADDDGALVLGLRSRREPPIGQEGHRCRGQSQIQRPSSGHGRSSLCASVRSPAPCRWTLERRMGIWGRPGGRVNRPWRRRSIGIARRHKQKAGPPNGDPASGST